MFALNKLLPRPETGGKNGNIFILTLENGPQVC
jgi:hypothetical protein